MSERISLPPTPDKITVLAWNILLDRKHGDLVPPQDERLESHAKSLGGLGLSLDVVGIVEAEKTKTQHNGHELAHQLGFDESHWHPHSRKNEYIGMFGHEVGAVETLDIGYKKTALITMVGGVCIVLVHIKFPQRQRDHITLTEQRQQVEVVLDRVKDEDHVVIMGDWNCSPGRKPRKLIEAQGLRSVYEMHGDEHRPHTVLRGEYDFMLTPNQRRILRQFWPLGVNADDIYVKNMLVHNAGTVTGASDHLGVWATLSAKTAA